MPSCIAISLYVRPEAAKVRTSVSRALRRPTMNTYGPASKSGITRTTSGRSIWIIGDPTERIGGHIGCRLTGPNLICCGRRDPGDGAAFAEFTVPRYRAALRLARGLLHDVEEAEDAGLRERPMALPVAPR